MTIRQVVAGLVLPLALASAASARPPSTRGGQGLLVLAANKAPTAAAAVSPQEAVDRANAYFNRATTMIAGFVQLGADGKRLQGRLYVQKPGHLRFEYDPPAPIEIVADGRSVAVKDVKLAKQDLYFIGQTPLKFLLQDQIDLARDTKVLDVDSNPRTTSISIEDSETFGGTSHITLSFDTATFQLQQWMVADPQGYETSVSLFDVDLSHKPDPALFTIDERGGNTRK
jgi:outer membrane lipoprotein-sorting protein